MTPAGELLREEITKSGPVSFQRFMEAALYHPEHGYYRRMKDPFGKHGDFYTAEQIQPTFGILIALYVRQILEEIGIREGYSVVELGAGRGAMADHFDDCEYVPIEFGDRFPHRIRGLVFANEFFDALPVCLVKRRGNRFREMRVGWEHSRFGWVEGDAVAGEIEDYLAHYAAPSGEGALLEVSLEALRWIERISESLEEGFLLAIDYGYTAAETIRFPAGTLMSYSKHVAYEDVLQEPGNRDITAHVCFTALEGHALKARLHRVRYESMSRMLLRAGEADQFAAVLDGCNEQERARRLLQLKTLMFGMGETFLTLLLRKQ